MNPFLCVVLMSSLVAAPSGAQWPLSEMTTAIAAPFTGRTATARSPARVRAAATGDTGALHSALRQRSGAFGDVWRKAWEKVQKEGHSPFACRRSKPAVAVGRSTAVDASCAQRRGVFANAAHARVTVSLRSATAADSARDGTGRRRPVRSAAHATARPHHGAATRSGNRGTLHGGLADLRSLRAGGRVLGKLRAGSG